ncbi:phospholipase DDHD1 isoform X2 [Gadus chalcogrammus]|uniref:phospholipase DDHD1 isoform X2 n=1 Tax=Gadus chalcogrammus TaxID=1042646 RepID=UPI0024C34173|nr:phospholipase DDHD1 isoform X2 [Gadus chalcogrammus]
MNSFNIPNKTSSSLSSALSADNRVRLADVNCNHNDEWDDDVYMCFYDKTMGEATQSSMPSVQSGLDGHLPRPHGRPLSTPGGLLGLSSAFPAEFPSRGSASSYFHTNSLDYNDTDVANEGPMYGSRKRTRSNSSRQRYNEVVDELGPEEVRWFYKEDKKTWKPFVGHDSLKIELSFRKSCELNTVNSKHNGNENCPSSGGEGAQPNGLEGMGLSGPVYVDNRPSSVQVDRGLLDSPAGSSDARDPDDIKCQVEHVCVRGGLYEVDAKERECYPVYWNQQDRIPVMRAQWFIDGTWLPLEEEESDLIEQEHLTRFRGQQMQDNFESDVVARTVDSKDGLMIGPWPDVSVALTLLSAPWLSGTPKGDSVHSLKLSRTHVDWHSVDEVYLYSDATTSKIARSVTQKLGFSKASSSGTRLHRGYVEEASLEDRPPQTTHVVFVVHGIGQKMDQGRIIKNTGMLREAVRKMEEKHFSENHGEHVEFLPVEWRSKLALDGDTVDSITPDKVRGLRDLLNSSAMDIMYYTSPLYRDEITKGLTHELNRLYSLFCSRNPEFVEKGGKVSMVSHSLGCVIAFDIMTGWDPVRFCLQEHQAMEEELALRWLSYEEKDLMEQLQSTRTRLRELEGRLGGLEASKPSAAPALKFKVENFFCMGSPLAVFLALRGIRPGSSVQQDHILPTSICRRLFNVFHPTDPVAYRLEPLILKHYSNIAPVQIHWCSANPTPYDEIRPTFLTPVKDPTSDSESLPSPSTSPVLIRRHYGESITNLGKAGILGAASIGKGIGGILFSRFSRSSSQPSVSLGLEEGAATAEGEEPKKADSQSAYSLSTMAQSGPAVADTSLELERRIDFELPEGLVESRYWSAVTSHTGYWISHDVALFLLTFIYKQKDTPAAAAAKDDLEQD